ncbi:MAG TPA: DUF4097 family beta strand repeat-containing protein [Xanthomonadaceae bacterium]|jgi:DUF4097 and DUF4098 domain-containing protein YvlB|nr:DUF4097 family beta strand repeat-containing protein [Xanthomonadaceae bacterium]
MWKLLTCALLLTPALAHADECRFEAPRNATLDLAGVRTLVIEVHQHNIHLNGSATATGQVHGRACASSQSLLAGLQMTQHREGDRLIVEAKDDNQPFHGISFFGNHYDYLDLNINVPASLAVEFDVGSGDAWANNVAQLGASVGSGDLDVTGVHGRFEAKVNSGDIKARDVGDTHVSSVGSGDFTVDQVHGSVAVGSVGSGDFTAEHVQGNVSVNSVGSGDATARTVGGNVDVGTIGSGDLRVNGVGHDLHVASVGSGDIQQAGVSGKVNIPKQD